MRLRAPSARAALLLALASVASASGVSSDVAFARAAVARADGSSTVVVPPDDVVAGSRRARFRGGRRRASVARVGESAPPRLAVGAANPFETPRTLPHPQPGAVPLEPSTPPWPAPPWPAVDAPEPPAPPSPEPPAPRRRHPPGRPRASRPAVAIPPGRPRASRPAVAIPPGRPEPPPAVAIPPDAPEPPAPPSPSPNPRCAPRSVPREERCAYVRARASCRADDRLLHYLDLHYCAMRASPASAAFHAGVVVVAANLLVVVASRFFIPAVENAAAYARLPGGCRGRHPPRVRERRAGSRRGRRGDASRGRRLFIRRRGGGAFGSALAAGAFACAVVFPAAALAAPDSARKRRSRVGGGIDAGAVANRPDAFLPISGGPDDSDNSGDSGDPVADVAGVASLANEDADSARAPLLGDHPETDFDETAAEAYPHPLRGGVHARGREWRRRSIGAAWTSIRLRARRGCLPRVRHRRLRRVRGGFVACRGFGGSRGIVRGVPRRRDSPGAGHRVGEIHRRRRRVTTAPPRKRREARVYWTTTKISTAATRPSSRTALGRRRARGAAGARGRRWRTGRGSTPTASSPNPRRDGNGNQNRNRTQNLAARSPLRWARKMGAVLVAVAEMPATAVLRVTMPELGADPARQDPARSSRCCPSPRRSFRDGRARSSRER